MTILLDDYGNELRDENGQVQFVEEVLLNELIDRRETLMDLFTPNGNNHDELTELLEIERGLTLREDI